jgi:hypothetical protein
MLLTGRAVACCAVVCCAVGVEHSSLEVRRLSISTGREQLEVQRLALLQQLAQVCEARCGG